MTSPINIFLNEPLDSNFFPVIDRLKNENILPRHSFLQDLPFFNFPHISTSSHIKELFFNSCDLDHCRSLLHSISPSSEAGTLSQQLSLLKVMNFAQLALYKVLPCPDSECPRCPREIATHNQYRDAEYECPFYHHEKDRRRLVITVDTEEEFVYKANYYEEGRRHGDKDKYSQNYFESMFHPLYYKMFKCKRDYCNASAFCPFFHGNDEKRVWDELFSAFVRKDRVSYVKDKQKYYESNTSANVKPENTMESVQREFYRPKVNKNRKNGVNQYNQHSHQHNQHNQQGYTVRKNSGEKSDRNRNGVRTWNVSSEDAYYSGFYGGKSDLGQEVC